jgi:serine O-acetyltransferase
MTDTQAQRLQGLAMRVRIRCLRPLVRASRRSPGRASIERDIERWVEVRAGGDLPGIETSSTDDALCAYLAVFKEFRNIFYYRLEHGGGLGLVVAKAARRVWRDVPSFELSCGDIGPGFVARHGYSSILTAERIGANCLVHHEVTLGFDEGSGRSPRIGDNVYIGAGAKVLGDVTIGNDVRIGANAVVITDVPDGCSAVGVPARIIPPSGRAAHERVADDR